MSALCGEGWQSVQIVHTMFVQVKPSDMLAEMQGRLPIRVELKGLT
jgi:ATP-dependent protease HslVU (ClpYQ) ATPase subunit